jgi:phosphatidylglycerophosphate synthase
MLPDLHTRQDKPDWEYVSSVKWSRWQRLAARTHGLVTPGNFVTLLGFIFVLIGLMLVIQKHYMSGLVLIIIGRLADVFDGYAAARTHTKSAVGELLDLTIDKAVVFLALLMLILFFDVSTLAVGLVLGINLLNGISTIVAKLQGRAKHPSRAGKYAMVICWVIIGLLIVQIQAESVAVNRLIQTMCVLYACIGGWASYHYMRQMFAK